MLLKFMKSKLPGKLEIGIALGSTVSAVASLGYGLEKAGDREVIGLSQGTGSPTV